jgi:hypothetical protein
MCVWLNVILRLRMRKLIALLMLFPLILEFVDALPIYSELENINASPRISCLKLDDKDLVCKKFSIPFVRLNGDYPITSPSQSTTLDSIQDTHFTATEEQQIQRIMDTDQRERKEESRSLWSMPDVQVVLWFVLLCCLTEGLVAGFQW